LKVIAKSLNFFLQNCGHPASARLLSEACIQHKASKATCDLYAGQRFLGGDLYASIYGSHLEQHLVNYC